MFSTYRNDDEDYVPPIIERVQNIGGSTAAPGTGEFHKYKAIRRKEILAELIQEKAERKRKMQEDFENDKKQKQLILDNQALKRKRKRDKKKLKKKILQNSKKNNNVFSKDIPLLEQVKDKMSAEEYKKLLVEDNKPKNGDDNVDIDEIELVPRKGEQRIELIPTKKENEKEKEKEPIKEVEEI